MPEMSNPELSQIIQHLKGVPIFDRLVDDELEKIYNICDFKKFPADQVIYQFGAESDSLFILLDGRLVARTKAGLDIAYISPIGLVGEMGVLTDQPRSADVVALDEAIGFQISKKDLIDLFIADSAICRKILLNIIKTLSQKLYDTNADIEKLRSEASQQTPQASRGDNIFLY
jgi:CRP-like cAMP-binding protein